MDPTRKLFDEVLNTCDGYTYEVVIDALVSALLSVAIDMQMPPSAIAAYIASATVNEEGALH